MSSTAPEPAKDCTRCSRLVAFRNESISAHPDWFNGAVPSFGDENAQFLIVGLAPGLQGAHRTGRPFTGDYAGDLLYRTLAKFGWSQGTYRADPEDGLVLKNCMITNAVRCVPPQNKPVGAEITECRPFLANRMDALPDLRVVLALGRIAHDSIVRAAGLKLKDAPFGHAARNDLGRNRILIDSYHCSRYNTNTGRLTTEMFEDVFRAVAEEL
ncbi:MAG: uracil-DNA glycosylase [Hyphomicrobiaceae bacterium]